MEVVGKNELEVVVEVYDCARKLTADVHHYGSHLHSYFLMTNPANIDLFPCLNLRTGYLSLMRF